MDLVNKYTLTYTHTGSNFSCALSQMLLKIANKKMRKKKHESKLKRGRTRRRKIWTERSSIAAAWRCLLLDIHTYSDITLNEDFYFFHSVSHVSWFHEGYVLLISRCFWETKWHCCLSSKIMAIILNWDEMEEEIRQEWDCILLLRTIFWCFYEDNGRSC